MGENVSSDGSSAFSMLCRVEVRSAVNVLKSEADYQGIDEIRQ
jgi:hypothetical protein